MALRATRWIASAGKLVIAVLSPFLTLQGYFALVRNGFIAPNTSWLDTFVLVGGVSLGSLCLVALPLSSKERAVLVVCYLIVAIPVSILYGIGIACVEFSQCL